MIMMNYVEGTNLQSLIFDEAKDRVCNLSHLLATCILQLSFLIKIQISIQIAQVLMFLHTARPPTVHLDVKPANILVC